MILKPLKISLTSLAILLAFGSALAWDDSTTNNKVKSIKLIGGSCQIVIPFDIQRNCATNYIGLQCTTFHGGGMAYAFSDYACVVPFRYYD